jgi:molecular chaperone DnaK (HSP70)
VDVDDASVQQMVEESVEHAFEDLAARRWIEKKLKANELKAATRKAMDDCDAELDGAYKSQLNTALARLDEVLAGEQGTTGIGNTQLLEKACAEIDELSMPLAELLMDKAMESLLRKRGLTS